MMGFYKLIERIIEAISFVKIMLSPTLIGVFIGIIYYTTSTNSHNLFVSIGIAVIGLITGILLAIRVSKHGGATEFNARINASSDISEAV